MENQFEEEQVQSPVSTTEETTHDAEPEVKAGDAAFEEEDLNDEGEFEDAEEVEEVEETEDATEA